VPPLTLAKKLGLATTASCHEANGCPQCRGTGYLGRTVVTEIMKVGPALQDAIVKRSSEADLLQLAKQDGMLTLFDAGLRLVSEGTTSLEEVFRVIQSEPSGQA
jgi:type II secretory ATPase GspE/PulE/Tfp pilus assembly ATPase PilB-like protein